MQKEILETKNNPETKNTHYTKEEVEKYVKMLDQANDFLKSLYEDEDYDEDEDF